MKIYHNDNKEEVKMMKRYDLAVIPGDGIGKEVVPSAVKVLQTAATLHGGIQLETTELPWGCDYYLKHGKMMSDDGLERLKNFDAIFLGAVGDPNKVPDHISLWGLLIHIRREFEQTINIRPAKLFKGLTSPLVDPGAFNFLVVRENSEGEYSESGGRIHKGTDEIAIQNAIFTRKATERVMDYAFKQAVLRKGHVTSATKSNGIVHSMPFWDEVFKDVSERYTGVRTSSVHIDALAAFFVSKPSEFDVIVASNLFGDILTDIGGAIMGSIGIAPAGNININGKYPSMFEPVHGSAPDIYGKGIANPIGQIWTASLMLDHLGEVALAREVLRAMEEVTDAGVKTRDIGGNATTDEVTNKICLQLQNNIG